MSTTKIINSLKVDTATDADKVLKVDSSGNLTLVDPKDYYIALTDGTEDVYQETEGTYVYTLADFVGTGIDTDSIKAIHIQTVINLHWDQASNYSVSVIYPDGTTNVIHKFDRSAVGGPDVAEKQEHVTVVPIDPTQTTFTITIDSDIGSDRAQFTLLGVTQNAL